MFTAREHTCSKKAACSLRQVSLQAGARHVGLLCQLPLLQVCVQLPSRKVGACMLRLLCPDGGDNLQGASCIALGSVLSSLHFTL